MANVRPSVGQEGARSEEAIRSENKEGRIATDHIAEILSIRDQLARMGGNGDEIFRINELLAQIDSTGEKAVVEARRILANKNVPDNG